MAQLGLWLGPVFDKQCLAVTHWFACTAQQSGMCRGPCVLEALVHSLMIMLCNAAEHVLLGDKGQAFVLLPAAGCIIV